MIRIFVTGGTFDKTYDEIEGALAFGDTHLNEMLRLGRCEVEVSVRTLMMVDSMHSLSGTARSFSSSRYTNATNFIRNLQGGLKTALYIRVSIPVAPRSTCE